MAGDFSGGTEEGAETDLGKLEGCNDAKRDLGRNFRGVPGKREETDLGTERNALRNYLHQALPSQVKFQIQSY